MLRLSSNLPDAPRNLAGPRPHMHLRTRYRLSAMPTFLILAACVSVAAMLLVYAYEPAWKFLSSQFPYMPWIVFGVAALVALGSIAWYVLTWAEVKRGVFKVRTVSLARSIDLRELDSVYVYARTASERRGKKHQLLLQLIDVHGTEAWLPLNVWRDEDLLMARILRATIERKVKIDGDPKLVRRFTGLLHSYRSWDRQQAAA